MSKTSVSYLWREQRSTAGFDTGVSLHSHTNFSRETLDFIAELSRVWPITQPILRLAERHCTRRSGIQPNYAGSFWTPPLTPRLALELERRQIEDQLQLASLVSITDHDDISAPMLLRSVPSARHMPISVEWTVPFGETAFHLGVHNLPAAQAQAWMSRLAQLTEDLGPGSPVAQEPETAGRLRSTLAELDELRDVLLVFNHPLWDLFRIGAQRHVVLMNEFLARFGGFVHALELNGLRNWAENRDVQHLAAQWNQLTISGGDRHGIEPNANLNLTRATTFTEFVHELRRDRESHVLFMPQYAEPWKHRILQSTLDAIRNHGHLPVGSQRWDERVFHPDADGILLPLSELWPQGHPPRLVKAVVATVRTLGSRPVARGLRYHWGRNAGETVARRATLAHLDA